MAASDGKRRIVDMGNVQQNLSWPINNQLLDSLSQKQYLFWKVQAIDQGFLGSSFSQLDTIKLFAPIQSVTDIPNDQGGKVRVNWDPCILDRTLNEWQYQIQYYGVWRKIPIGSSKNESYKDKTTKSPLYVENDTLGTLYDLVTTVPAVQSPSYNIVSSTLADSSVSGIPFQKFIITAHTANPNTFFISPPKVGYSVDNIAPLAPTNLNGLYNNNQIALHWNPNKENDFKEYVLYRSTTPNINPSTDTVFVVTTDTSFTDANLSLASNEVEIVLSGILQDGTEIPQSYALYQNYPNPFNPYTLIKFDLPKSSKVRVNIFNSLGENVATLVNETMSPGKYQYIWKPEYLATGLYFYVIQAENFRSVKKMLLVK